MYGRPGHRVRVEAIWDVFTAVGGLQTLSCGPGNVYVTTAGKGLTGYGDEAREQPNMAQHCEDGLRIPKGATTVSDISSTNQAYLKNY
eukprot:2028253-Prymnesium_polylepis.1